MVPLIPPRGHKHPTCGLLDERNTEIGLRGGLGRVGFVELFFPFLVVENMKDPIVYREPSDQTNLSTGR